MPTIGGVEMLVIAIVAIVVVGPKDLPKLLRGFGQMMSRMRGMARDFQDSMDELARESELEELRGKLVSARDDNVLTRTKKDVEDALTPMAASIGLDDDTPENAIADPVAMEEAARRHKAEGAGETGANADAAEPAVHPHEPEDDWPDEDDRTGGGATAPEDVKRAAPAASGGVS